MNHGFRTLDRIRAGNYAPLMQRAGLCDLHLIDPALMICIVFSHPFRKKRGKGGARCGISFGPNQ